MVLVVSKWGLIKVKAQRLAKLGKHNHWKSKAKVRNHNYVLNKAATTLAKLYSQRKNHRSRAAQSLAKLSSQRKKENIHRSRAAQSLVELSSQRKNMAKLYSQRKSFNNYRSRAAQSLAELNSQG